ncbi:MAG: hypothetical protein RBS56_00730 [Candidatus Gracilibacteria bacterium]|jgi:hypothetical protein|nr:hypothetical protein [Candidatus Gracilibacteria bacterium]
MSSKVIKIYFYFLLVVLTIAGGSYVPSVKSVYNDSFEKLANYADGVKSLSGMRVNMASVVNFEGDVLKNTSTQSGNADDMRKSDDLLFEISSIKKFVKNAEYGANVLSIDLKSLEKDIELNNLALKIAGISPEKIESIYLTVGEKVIPLFLLSEDKFVFDLKGIVLSKASKMSFNLNINMADTLSVNERFYFEIERASDFTFKADGKEYSPRASYPQKSEFISVVGEKIQKNSLKNPE